MELTGIVYLPYAGSHGKYLHSYIIMFRAWNNNMRQLLFLFPNKKTEAQRA